MAAVALACLGLIVATTLVHYEVLKLLSGRLERQHGPQRTRLVAAVLGCFAAHGTEVIFYAFGYWALVGVGGLGTLGGSSVPDLSAALYFSVETYTSLGFGDVVPGGPDAAAGGRGGAQRPAADRVVGVVPLRRDGTALAAPLRRRRPLQPARPPGFCGTRRSFAVS